MQYGSGEYKKMRQSIFMSVLFIAGIHYLHIEGSFYVGIGILFLLYGYYRAVNRPVMSVILTIASLGTRVALAYILSATAEKVIQNSGKQIRMAR